MADFTDSQRAEISQLYRIMDIPGTVNVLRAAGKVWLTDGFVLLNVTGSPVVADLDDGLYRLQLRNGFIRRPDATTYRLPEFMTYLRRFSWHPVQATRWAQYPEPANKARLFFVQVGHERYALGLNEEIWRAVMARYPDAQWWHAGYGGPFKVTTPDNDELAYIEPARLPEDLLEEANKLVEVAHLWQSSDIRSSCSAPSSAPIIRTHDALWR
jgi:hypothetical protein